MRVTFVDTSVLCNIIPIPGRCQRETEARADLVQRLGRGETLVLPVTAVVEAGNFVAQIPDGNLRRATASTFSGILEMVASNQAPWVLHEFPWDGAFLLGLVEGAGTGVSLVEHAVAGVGVGDLSILQEMRAYKARTALHDVTVWTYDEMLGAYA